MHWNRLILLPLNLLLFWFILLPIIKAEIIDLSPHEFYNLAVTGEALIIDVRNTIGWNWGHIPNATYIYNFVPFLQRTPASQINATLEHFGIMNCLQHCSTIVYCRSSRAARRALDLLHDKAGFISANLYNGLGTSNWTDAGYPLVRTSSHYPPCFQLVDSQPVSENSQYCPITYDYSRMEESTTTPTLAPTDTTISSSPTLAPTDTNSSSTLAPTTSTTTSTTQAQQQQKVSPESKCGSLTSTNVDISRGGSAAVAKDCDDNNGGRQRERRKRIRGL